MTVSSSYHNRHDTNLRAGKPTMQCKLYILKCQSVTYKCKSNSLLCFTYSSFFSFLLKSKKNKNGTCWGKEILVIGLEIWVSKTHRRENRNQAIEIKWFKTGILYSAFILYLTGLISFSLHIWFHFIRYFFLLFFSRIFLKLNLNFT